MKKIIFLIVAFVVMACSEHSIDDLNANKSLSNHIGIEEAKNNAIKFVSAINRQNATRGLAEHTIEIDDVEAVTSASSAKTRTQNVNNTNNDTLFYVVKFAGGNGFALASAKRNDEPIYAYIEEGEYSDFTNPNNNANNPGYEAFLGALYEHTSLANDPHEVDSSRFDENGNVKYNETIIIKHPLLVTKWGQSDPYNLRCEGNLAGCVPVALAQIWTYIEKLENISWEDGLNGGQSHLDWNAIKQVSKDYPGENLAFLSRPNETVIQIASLIRFMGCNSKASYGKDATGADSGYAIGEVKKMGVNVDGLRDFNEHDIIYHLRGNHIIFISGYGRYYHVGLVFRKYVDGHAWVIDGFIDRYEDGNRYLYLHCNWGWNGDKNGYFSSKVLNAEQKPTYDDEGKKTRASLNFRYNLKTAAIWK